MICFFFQAEDGIRDYKVTGVQTCALPIAALEKGFAGPKDSKGRQVYAGFPYDTGIAATQGIPGHLNGGRNPVGPAFTATLMDVDARAERALDANSMLTMTSGWTNLNTLS